VAEIASRADLITRLLQKEMPDRIEDVFAALDIYLLPNDEDDFQTACSCPDWANPCKHIAGVCYRLAADLDRDPFLLFALRGLSLDALVAELMKSSLGGILASDLTTGAPPVEPATSYFTRPIRDPASGVARHRKFWTGARRLPSPETLPQVRVPAVLIKKQGDYAPFWHRNESFIGVMEGLYERVRTKSNQMK
jgi:uncharacterized Zn finger protein